jgi:hemoglobin-like flavoprotein
MNGKVRLAQHEGHIFIVLPVMTPRQVRIVQQSFHQITPHAAKAAQIFYECLFQIAPHTRRLFPDDMTAQKSKLVQMLATVVTSLGNVSAISEHLADLGRRHASYDVTERHYVYVGQALLLMLQRLLGPNYTDDVQDAWSAAYNMLARTMLEAAPMPYPTSNFFNCIVRGVMTSQYGVSEVAAPSQAQSAPMPFTASVKRIRSF